ncbi:MAG: hypothetical protein ACMXYA_00615, partial [Candidatus Woesearchaeota archaeon]
MTHTKADKEVHDLLRYDYLKSQTFVLGFLAFLYIFMMYVVNNGMIGHVPTFFIMVINVFTVINTFVFLYYY